MARARLSVQGIPAHVLRMDAERLGLADASFDLVTVSRAYLLPRRRAVLGEIRRVLQPGGRVAVAEFGRLDPWGAWTRAVCARLLPGVQMLYGGARSPGRGGNEGGYPRSRR